MYKNQINKLIFVVCFTIGISYSFAQQESDDTLNVSDDDTVATMDTFQKNLDTSTGKWIKVNKSDIDADAVEADASSSSDVDENINVEYIWRPNIVEVGWNPYTNGYWQYTNCGWMWVSYYSWGWWPYHYGRWWYSGAWGWVWSPG